MELKRIGRQGLLLMMGLWASGCALVEQRADDAAWQGEPVLIGTVGDKQYQLKDLTVRPSHRVCDVAAYSAGFKNALVDRWDTNAMLDRLPKRLYFNVRPVNLRGFLATAPDRQCVEESIVVGEADGDQAGKRLYQEFIRRYTGR